MVDKFMQQLADFDIHLNDQMQQKFHRYYELLVEWNRVMNLTSITEYGEVYEKHFIDSLAVVKEVNMGEIRTVIDVGTGAGFPGLPLKIVFPHLKVVLLDSLNKRVNFLNTVMKDLELDGIEAFHGRAEDFAREGQYREHFDLCVSRAVANLSTLSEYCIPFIKVNGIFISYKSGHIEEEVCQSERAISILGGKIKDVIKFQIPGTEIGRAFVKIQKINKTQKRYPRKAGMPSKEPL